ncbi:alanine--tRNA ligase [bacterium]|nr:MAG: alanine--tRNA ligase [bacterium]
MTSSEIRQKFLEFFEKKEHTVIPSASLIPENDSTVLFTTAGMHPLVPFLLGEVHPGGKRVASVQKCIRTGDIDEVGDDVHLTFFEMLGNWSFGDYWKEDAINWSFEFLTKELKLPIEKLAISCFTGDKDAPRDDESAKIWESLGIPKERIYFLPKKDNWWGPAGETGPCGPDTEIFYWTGEGEPEPLTTGDNKEKWVEIWNDVFMQYNKRADGAFEPLKQKNVDTGMGVERTVSVVNKQDLFLIDTIEPLIRKVEELSRKKYTDSGETTRAMRIIVDHLRAATFILGDERGVVPSNVGQGYVLRRLIRRAVRYGRMLGIKMTPFSTQIVPKIIELYPELQKNQAQILSGLAVEEEKFAVALEKGLREFERLTAVDGKIAFDLYQSYGFPIELTEELSSERGFTIDKKIFEEEFRKHQELSRTASAGQFKGGLADNSEQVVKLHTATHLLHQALIDVLGGTVDQKGSNITAERLRFDFVCPRKMTPEEVKKVEKLVNQKISEDLPVHFELLTIDEAKSKEAIGIFDDKYAQIGGKVKVYFVGDYSKEICGGPHVTHTGEIGKFKITKEEPVAAGIRRIRATVE